MKKLKNPILKIVGLVVAGIVITVAVLLIRNSPLISKNDVLKNPNKVVQEAFDRTFNNIENSTFTPFEVAEQSLTSGSISLSNGNEITGVISHDLTNQKYLTNFKVGDTKWSWALYGSDLYIGEEDNMQYHIPTTNLSEFFWDSQIPEAEGVHDVPFCYRVNAFYPRFTNACKNQDSDVCGTTKILINDLLAIIFQETALAKEETIENFDGQADVYSIEYTLSHKNTVALLETLSKWCSEYEHGYDDYVSNIIKMMISETTDTKYAQQEYKEHAETVINNLNILAIRSERESLFKVCVNPKNGNVVLLNWLLIDEIYGKQTEVSLNIEFPAEYKDENRYKIQFSQNNGSKYSSFNIVFDLTQKENKNEVTNTLLVDYEGMGTIWKEEESYIYSKNDNSFSFESITNGQKRIISGSASIMGEETRIVIDKMMLGEAEYLLNISAIFNKTPLEHVAPTDAANVLIADLSTAQTFITKTRVFPTFVFGPANYRTEE